MSAALKSLRLSVAEYLCMAVWDLFPGSELGTMEVTDTCFICQFRFLQPKHPELLFLLETKLRGLLKPPPVLESVEMGREGAHNYFMHHDQLSKAHHVREWPWTMIPMVRCGPFFDLYRGVLYEGDWEGVAFQLLEANEKDGWVEIKGTAFSSKEELKAFIKKRKAYLKEKPWQRGEAQALFLPSTTTLLPAGVELYHRLENFWSRAIKKGDLAEVVMASKAEQAAISQKLGKGVAEWGRSGLGAVDLCHLFVAPQQMAFSCSSSLRFIHETFNTLQLNTRWTLFCGDPFGLQSKQWKQEVKWLTEALELAQLAYTVDPALTISNHPRVELQIEDSLGEYWSGPFLTFCTEPKTSIEYSLLGSTKRLIALLAEYQKISLDILKDY